MSDELPECVQYEINNLSGGQHSHNEDFLSISLQYILADQLLGHLYFQSQCVDDHVLLF